MNSYIYYTKLGHQKLDFTSPCYSKIFIKIINTIPLAIQVVGKHMQEVESILLHQNKSMGRHRYKRLLGMLK